MNKTKIVVIGGGTGTFVVLSGLKKYDLDISVIVSMMDSGGSTGRLRDQLGVLPPGDLRQCLVALSDASELWRELFLYRFNSGDLKGHNFGNIFITALEKNAVNYQEVVDTAAFILKIKGKVIPVTFDKVHLGATYEDGETLEKEGIIDVAFHKTSRIDKAYLKPKAGANKAALAALKRADYIVMGPGDLYTGIIPNLLVDDIAETIRCSKSKIIYIANLFTKHGQTTEYTVENHVADIEKYLGRKIDMILINNGKIPAAIVNYYRTHNEIPVADDLINGRKIYRDDLLSTVKYSKPKGDSLPRSVIRHDSDKVAAAIYSIVKK